MSNFLLEINLFASTMTRRQLLRLQFLFVLNLLISLASVCVVAMVTFFSRRKFSQKYVNHSKVAYMPPLSDIGVQPIHIQFLFTVTTESGISLPAQRFTIKVLPVDNQVGGKQSECPRVREEPVE